MSSYAPAYSPRNHTLDAVVGLIKLISFLGSAAIAAFLISNSLHLNIRLFQPADPTIIARIPVTYTFFPDVGKVYTPHIEANLVNPDGKLVPATFLLDSGAKISALPMQYAQELQLDTATAKRIYLRSATNTTTYGYLTEMTLQIEGKNITVPVTFADIIQPLLGTFGFFDKYTILFDHVANEITIKGK